MVLHTLGQHDVHGLAAQCYELQQSFPVALLIAAAIPGYRGIDKLTSSITKRYLRGTKMSGHCRGCTVEQSLALDSHGKIFNGKQKPRIFMSGVRVQSLDFSDYDVASLKPTPAAEFSWKPV